MSPGMDSATHLAVTIGILLSSLAMAALCWHLGTRERNALKPRMMPWKFITFGLLATALMVLVHLANILGWETGGGMPGMSR